MLDALFVLIHQRVVSFTPDFFFFFNDTATTEIYTLSLHDALPISRSRSRRLAKHRWRPSPLARHLPPPFRRRWRLSHAPAPRSKSSLNRLPMWCARKMSRRRLWERTGRPIIVKNLSSIISFRPIPTVEH